MVTVKLTDKEKKIKKLIEFIAFAGYKNAMNSAKYADSQTKKQLNEFYNKIEYDDKSIVDTYNEYVEYINSNPNNWFKLSKAENLNSISEISNEQINYACKKIKELDSEGKFAPFLNSITAVKDYYFLENLDTLLFGHKYPIKKELNEQEIQQLKKSLMYKFNRDEQFVNQLIDPLLEYRAATIDYLNKHQKRLGRNMTPKEKKYLGWGITLIILSVALGLVGAISIPFAFISSPLIFGILSAVGLLGVIPTAIGANILMSKKNEIEYDNVRNFIDPKGLASYVTGLIEKANLKLSEPQLQKFIKRTKDIELLKEFYQLELKNSKIDPEFVKNNPEAFGSTLASLKVIVDGSKDSSDFNSKINFYIEIKKDYEKIVNEINKGLGVYNGRQYELQHFFNNEENLNFIADRKFSATLKEKIIDTYTHDLFVKVNRAWPDEVIDKFKELASKENCFESEIKEFAKECKKYIPKTDGLPTMFPEQDIPRMIKEVRERIANCNKIITEAKKRADIVTEKSSISTHTFKTLKDDLVNLFKPQELGNQK
ncbi:MAG: hypothetical protein J0H68_08755 [Sphingobacteriia bacterium]|nr:hypothetical protein [Sphingobacteriia bacterium]